MQIYSSQLCTWLNELTQRQSTGFKTFMTTLCRHCLTSRLHSELYDTVICRQHHGLTATVWVSLLSNSYCCWPTWLGRGSSDCTQPSRSHCEAKIWQPRQATEAVVEPVSCLEELIPTAVVSLDAESFCVVFVAKVDGVWQSTAAAFPQCFMDLRSECRFVKFEPVDAATV